MEWGLEKWMPRLKQGTEWTLSAPAPPPDMLQISLFFWGNCQSPPLTHSQAQVEELIIEYTNHSNFLGAGSQTQAGLIQISPPHLAIVSGSRLGKSPSLGFSQLDLGESSFLSDSKAEKMWAQSRQQPYTSHVQGANLQQEKEVNMQRKTDKETREFWRYSSLWAQSLRHQSCFGILH